ncbi:MAG: hypothetical protein F6K16_40685, partial [Symploca sp. SIO2B6]|nr:hypothetical protein [Symploca sp. SIO2B6]
MSSVRSMWRSLSRFWRSRHSHISRITWSMAIAFVIFCAIFLGGFQPATTTPATAAPTVVEFSGAGLVQGAIAQSIPTGIPRTLQHGIQQETQFSQAQASPDQPQAPSS